MVELYAKNTNANTQITFLSFIVVHIYIGKPSYISFLVQVKLYHLSPALHCIFPYVTQTKQLYEYMNIQYYQSLCNKILVKNLLTYVNDNSESYSR